MTFITQPPPPSHPHTNPHHNTTHHTTTHTTTPPHTHTHTHTHTPPHIDILIVPHSTFHHLLSYTHTHPHTPSTYIYTYTHTIRVNTIWKFESDNFPRESHSHYSGISCKMHYNARKKIIGALRAPGLHSHYSGKHYSGI